MTQDSRRFATVPARVFLACFIGALLFVAGVSSAAQSVDKKAPAPLQDGSNSGLVDSLIGTHYWYFFAEPGSFQLSFTRGGAQGLGASGRASIVSGFSPATANSHMTFKESPDGVVYSGTVTTRTRVGIGINPPNSPLVRSTAPYTLTATGHVAFDSAKDLSASIAGMYVPFLSQTSEAPPLGATKFNGDGTIETANGQTGTWKVFDKDSGTVIVVLAGQRLSLRFDPGRGFIDPRSGLVTFARDHK